MKMTPAIKWIAACATSQYMYISNSRKIGPRPRFVILRNYSCRV